MYPLALEHGHTDILSPWDKIKLGTLYVIILFLVAKFRLHLTFLLVKKEKKNEEYNANKVLPGVNNGNIGVKQIIQ